MQSTGYGNDTSILGVPDIPIWLLRHDGEFCARFHYWACRLHKILHAWMRQLNLTNVARNWSVRLHDAAQDI